MRNRRQRRSIITKLGQTRPTRPRLCNGQTRAHAGMQDRQDREELQQLTADIAKDTQDSREENMKTERASSPLVSVSYSCGLILAVLIAYKCAADKDGLVLFSLHPMCMVLGWMLLASAAIHAISGGDSLTSWIPVKNASTRHWILQLSGFLFMGIGFVAIFVNKMMHNKSHFTSFHGIFGLVTGIAVLISGSVGLAALYGMKLKQLLAPVYLKLIHGAVGVVTYALAFVTIILGLSSGWMSDNAVIQYSCMTLALVVSLTTLLRPSVKLVVRTRERINYVTSIH